MKERPILFSGPMVRAIREGRKTQTRRIVAERLVMCVGKPDAADCPYGESGDRLWVRETWAVGRGYDGVAPRDLPPRWGALKHWYAVDGEKPEWAGTTRVSIHMPRAFSRITLAVTSVRVERLQDITEDDAKAEGFPLPGAVNGTLNGEPCTTVFFQALPAFAYLWQQLNGERAAWASNPWVWVVGFELDEVRE